MAMRTVIESNAPSSSMARMAYVILPALADEMTEEMEEMDEPTIRVIMAQIGSIIAWIGHGDNSALPDSLRPFAEGIQPSPVTADDDIVEAEIVG